MSDNEDSTASLGESEKPTVENPCGDAVAALDQPLKDDGKVAALMASAHCFSGNADSAALNSFALSQPSVNPHDSANGLAVEATTG
jgi:hypothetical protein